MKPADHGNHSEASPAAADASEWLVDGYNVIHVILLGGADREGWWREDNRLRLEERTARLPVDRGSVWLVFDGGDNSAAAKRDPGSGAAPRRSRRIFAPSADDWIVRRVKARLRDGVASIRVVTADRKLAARARHAGAEVISPADFVAACAEPGTQDPPPDGPQEPRRALEPTDPSRATSKPSHSIGRFRRGVAR